MNGGKKKQENMRGGLTTRPAGENGKDEAVKQESRKERRNHSRILSKNNRVRRKKRTARRCEYGKKEVEGKRKKNPDGRKHTEKQIQRKTI